MHDDLGLRPPVFDKLLAELKEYGGLQEGSRKRSVKADEKLATFLYMVRKGVSNRTLAHLLNRSQATISM